MNVLLDTHALIWYSHTPEQLSQKALEIINSQENTISISQVSIWEMQIKISIGKLDLPQSVRELIECQIVSNGFRELNIRNEHLWGLTSLPLHHKDPFDRLLISQAQTDGLVLLSKDSKFATYDVQTIW